jgi:beta-glucosidase
VNRPRPSEGSGRVSRPEPCLPPDGRRASVALAARPIDALVAEMTLPEKIGQMTQVDKGSITPAEVADFGIGSVLSGGGGNPPGNDASSWADMVGSFVEAGFGSRLGIPVVYGVDAVHGHSNVRGATIFPHNIGLGAAGDADLVRRIGLATALEMAATGVRWTFAPTVAVPQDIRWGRTYEGYGRDPSLVAALGAALVDGLQGDAAEGPPVLACLKHFVGDGGTTWGSVTPPSSSDWWEGWGPEWQIDQGDLRVSEDVLRSVHLPPYAAGIAAGARSVMASYSSWNGEKLHGHRRLLTDVLKGELGFDGFTVTDWMGIDQLGPSYEAAVVAAINAGIDMAMVPFDFRRFIAAVTDGVTDGCIPLSRIDDAVRRILTAKASIGLHAGATDRPRTAVVGSSRHRALAAEAARRSAVLLVNDGTLPLRPVPDPLDLAGAAADDIGLQCGGWTVEWQGAVGPITPGTTFRSALEATVPSVRYEADGRFPEPERSSVGIVCVAEDPYAEGPGDRAVPTVRQHDRVVFERMRARCDRLVVLVFSGRPLVIPDVLERADAVVAAWLPGSEATELPGLLLGLHPFEGRSPQPWPRSAADLDTASLTPLYSVGHGLTLAAVDAGAAGSSASMGDRGGHTP